MADYDLDSLVDDYDLDALVDESPPPKGFIERQADKMKGTGFGQPVDVDATAKGFGRWAGQGLDDVAAGAGATLGAFSQGVMDGKTIPMVASNGYEAGKRGKAERRADVDAAAARSPGDYNTGAAGGVALTLPLGAGKNLSQTVLRGFGLGAVNGYGIGDGDTAEEDLVNAGVGGTVGALLPMAPTALRAGKSAVRAAAPGIADVATVLKNRIKPLDIIEMIPGVGPPIKKFGSQVSGVLDDVAAMRAKRPQGAVEVLDPAISDDFVSPETIDVMPDAPGGPRQLKQGSPRALAAPGDDLDDLVDARMAPESPAAAREPIPSDDLDGLLDVEGMTAADMVPEQSIGEPFGADLPPQPPKKAFRGWSDDFDDAGLSVDFDSGKNPNVKRVLKQASDSLDRGTPKRTQQRGLEQERAAVASPPEPTSQSQMQAYVDETGAFIATMPEARRLMAVQQLAATFGEDAAKAVARRAGVPWARVTGAQNQADLVSNLQSLQEAP